jgi:hypothetical protein
MVVAAHPNIDISALKSPTGRFPPGDVRILFEDGRCGAMSLLHDFELQMGGIDVWPLLPGCVQNDNAASHLRSSPLRSSSFFCIHHPYDASGAGDPLTSSSQELHINML